MAGKIRVAIVDDVQESRDNVERLLRFEPDIEIVGSVSRGSEAVELALARNPHVILMDVNMPDMDGIEATTAIMAQKPNIGVIMMSVLNEPDTLRRAMLAGAREFLVKPFSLDELLNSVHSVHNLVSRLPQVQVAQTVPAAAPVTAEKPSGRATIISVVSCKGGVGRSTVACNLAVKLRELSGKRVALVDADLSFGDVGVLMNTSDAKTILDVVPFRMHIDAEALESVFVDHSSGVQLLLAPTSPQDAEVVAPDMVRSILDVMTEMFDYVVVDTRPGFDDLNLVVYDISDLMMLMVTMDMTAIKDARQFLEISELLGYSGDRIRVVLNRSNNYSGIPSEEIGESLRRPLWAQIPDEPGPVLRSINEGVPIVSSAGDSKTSQEITRMAQEFLSEQDPESVSQTTKESSRRPSIIGKLRVGWKPAS
jgi:pilus assembly protein CpaE